MYAGEEKEQELSTFEVQKLLIDFSNEIYLSSLPISVSINGVMATDTLIPAFSNL